MEKFIDGNKGFADPKKLLDTLLHHQMTMAALREMVKQSESPEAFRKLMGESGIATGDACLLYGALTSGK